MISNILQKHLSAIWNMDSCLARPIPAQCTVKPTTCCGLAPLTPLSIPLCQCILFLGGLTMQTMQLLSLLCSDQTDSF